METKFRKAALAPRGLDPAALDAWDAGADGVSVAAPFRASFSMQEAMLSKLPGGCPAELRRPLLGLRQAFLAVGQECAVKFEGADRGHLLPRFAVENEDKSEVLMWDVLRVGRVANDTSASTGACGTASAEEDCGGPDRAWTPVLTVRWCYYTAASLRRSMASVQESLRLNPPGTRVVKVYVPSGEVQALKALLEASAKRLDPAFVGREEQGLPEGWRVSTIQPLSTEALKQDGNVAPNSAVAGGASSCSGARNISGKTCAACGASRASKVCTRCKETRYCSRECQAAHWKAHKVGCKAPGVGGASPAPAEGGGGSGGSGRGQHDDGLVRVDLRAPANSMQAANPGLPMAMMTMSFTSSAKAASRDVTNSGGSEGQKLPHKDDVLFVVKVQINTSGFKPDDPMGMMVYDKSRRFSSSISGTNCPPGPYRRLDATIRQGPIFGKGYFKAYFSQGRELVVVAHQPLPLQPW